MRLRPPAPSSLLTHDPLDARAALEETARASMDAPAAAPIDEAAPPGVSGADARPPGGAAEPGSTAPPVEASKAHISPGASPRAIRVLGAVFLVVWLVAAAPWQGAVGPALVALVLGAVGAALARGPAAWLPKALLAPSPRVFAVFAVVLSFGVSLWFVRTVCPQQPISIDASIYVNEARALAHGHFGMPVPLPRQAFGGRFLFEGPDGAMYGVFPPGYPLFLAPFVATGTEMLAGPIVAALLVLAQLRLGRTIVKDELAIRASIVLAVPSWARAIETADLLSHAFVGVLAAYAIAFAIETIRAPRWLPAFGLGVAAGWAITSRLLDGLLLGLVLAIPLGLALARRRLSPRWIVIAALGALPFGALLFAQQKAATGSWTRPTQSEYFARSDWPSTCHRIGFGKDVGCANEHPDARAAMGEDGYGLDDAALIIRERAHQVGDDLFGLGPVMVICFVPLLVRPRSAEALLATFVVALTIGYGLFYYGNAPDHGARHLFPLAPFAWLLAGRAIASPPRRAAEGRFDLGHVRGIALVALVAAAIAGAVHTYREKLGPLRGSQEWRSPVRATLAREGIERGILRARDNVGIYSATDLFVDPPSLFLVADDRAGNVELRRAHADLPMYLLLDHFGIGRFPPVVPPPGLTLEIESASPSFMRPDGLGGKWINPIGCCNVANTSGNAGLFLFDAHPGAALRFPFDAARTGRYALKMTGVAGPAMGRYDLALDGVVFARWDGYAKTFTIASTAPSEPRDVAAGAHLLELRCVGRADASTGYDALFDQLAGAPVP
jgi:hypothetical protein